MQFIEYNSASLIDFYSKNGLEFDSENNYFGTNVKSFVILENDKIIGSISFSKYKQKNFIEALAIQKDYRNKGYGKSLLKKAIKELEKPIYIISKANDFFLKNGFVYSNENLIDEDCKNCKEYEITCFPKVMIMNNANYN